MPSALSGKVISALPERDLQQIRCNKQSFSDANNLPACQLEPSRVCIQVDVLTRFGAQRAVFLDAKTCA
jgi:hypothetical protein